MGVDLAANEAARPPCLRAGLALPTQIVTPTDVAMKLVKRAVRQSLAMDLNTHLDMVSSHMLLTRPSEDHAEAIRAYEEGRKPVFKGK